MEIGIIGWLLLSIVVGIYASKKGNFGIGYFLLSLFLSPLIGFVFAFVAKPNEKILERELLKDGLHSKCPFCAEIIKNEASICKYCHKDLRLIKCPHCKEIMEWDVEICSYCHNKIN